jgi:CheY-like chemotaxis protein
MHVVNLSGQRLLDTINDIIEISKIEAGEQEVKNSAVDISEMMKYHLDFFQLQAKQKGIDLFISETITSDEAFAETDKNKLDSIFTNLIKNAIKFTTKGSIELGNYIENGSLVFYVKDTGCGISAEKMEVVFERFVQGDLSLTRSYEGSGLGLTIAKAYVHLLGGKIWVESEVDKGSTFYFSIPYKSKLGKNRISDAQDVLSDEYSKETIILVAEDDATSFQYLEVVLKKKNITPFRAVNGKEAILIFKQNPDISLILMDIKMPGMDGFEATKEIRKLNKKVPIIAQTAYALSGDEEKARKAGCNDYITKPIRSAELFVLLDKYLM